VASQLRFEAEAERELDDAALTYDEQRPGLGQRFLNEVGVTTERIRQFPGAGAPVKHVPAALGVRQAPVKGFPYHVVYLSTAKEIRVLAIAHYRRRPGYWLDR
jgi:plasmid stabilization system protein ParE